MVWITQHLRTAPENARHIANIFSNQKSSVVSLIVFEVPLFGHLCKWAKLSMKVISVILKKPTQNTFICIYNYIQYICLPYISILLSSHLQWIWLIAYFNLFFFLYTKNYINHSAGVFHDALLSGKPNKRNENQGSRIMGLDGRQPLQCPCYIPFIAVSCRLVKPGRALALVWSVPVIMHHVSCLGFFPAYRYCWYGPTKL